MSSIMSLYVVYLYYYRHMEFLRRLQHLLVKMLAIF